MPKVADASQVSVRLAHDAVIDIGAFATFHSLTVAILLALIRRHLDTGIVSLGVGFVHLCALVGLVILCLRWTDMAGDRLGVGPPIAFGAALAFLLPLCGFAADSFGVLAALAPAVAGAVAIGGRLRKSTMRVGAIISAAGGASVGIATVISLNGENYAHIFNYEFIQLGWQAADEVYHAAIASMFGSYGVPSTGLDGTPLIHYHVLSHVLIAGLAKESGELAPLVYPAAQQVFFIPALLFGCAIAVAFLCNFDRKITWLAPFAIALFWPVYEWIGGENSFLLSESYCCALAAFALAIPLLLGVGRFSAPQAMCWAAATGVIGLISVLAKYSLAFVWIILAGRGMGLGLRDRFPRLARLTGFATAAAYVIVLWGLFIFLGGVKALAFFNIVREYPATFWASIITIATAIPLCADLQRKGSPGPSPGFLLVLGVFLHVPDSFLNAGSGLGNEYYWFHPADILAGTIILASLLQFLRQPLSRSAWAGPALACAMAVASCLVLLRLPEFEPDVDAFASTLMAMDSLGGKDSPPEFSFAVAPMGGHEIPRVLLAPFRPPIGGLASLFGSLRVVFHYLRKGANSRLQQTIANSRLSVATRQIAAAASHIASKRRVLYISPLSGWFYASGRGCSERLFAFQALTGVALLKGIPAPVPECPEFLGYLKEYGASSESAILDDLTLCDAARKRAFQSVIRLSEDGSSARVICDDAP